MVAVMMLVDLAHGGVNVIFAKLKRVRISKMMAIVLNVMVVDLTRGATTGSITRKGRVVIKLQSGGFQDREAAFP